jgi:Mg-chelatase subunit ChlD
VIGSKGLLASRKAKMSIPNEFLCPIGLSLMKDPAIAPDGFTYERTAIAEWLSQNTVSPMTRQRMTSTELRSNHALRQTIEHWIAAHPFAEAVAAPPFKDVPLEVTAVATATQLHLRVAATGPEQRQPIVLLCIVDNSGSMGELASGGEGAESFGYTRLDLVKHTIRTIAAILGPSDQLGIVSFSTAARVVIVPTAMDDAGKSRISAALDTVQPDSQTNIWDGIRAASVLANAPELAGRNIVAALLTDGFPNINPPRGILPTLKSLDMKNQWSLHTFGFGYKLDSKLLADIAAWGDGLFGFIPDCSMVGTVFINFIANMLSTASRGQRIYYKIADTVMSLSTGPVQHGQVRDFVLPCSGPVSVSSDGLEWTPALAAEVSVFAKTRGLYLTTLEQMLALAEGGAGPMNMFRQFAGSGPADANVAALLADTNPGPSDEGQVSLAPRYWVKWGEHYLRSYHRAQLLQQSLNFKDPGLQIYGGDLFHQIQTAADTVFCTLPAPKPSAPPVADNYYGRVSASVSAPTTMATFHNASGGCFAGHCKVKMANGQGVPIKDICPGDIVWTPSGPAQVIALVTCGSKLRTQPMCQLGDLCITPWHPLVDEEKKWVFPADLTPYQDRLIDTVYNLVLTHGHIVSVEGYECVTLGHNLKGDVVAHDFFGTAAVVKDLMKLPGWSAGRPTFANLVTMRDPHTGMITGWVDSP